MTNTNIKRNQSEFTGKVVLVTGGGSGIGRATALAFAEMGAEVVIAGRRKSEGEETVQMIREGGEKATFVRIDVTKETEVEAMVEHTANVHGASIMRSTMRASRDLSAPLKRLKKQSGTRLLTPISKVSGSL